MQITWMNERQPLPQNHHKAGKIGLTIDFEDGVSDPQNVYADNEQDMNDKLARNYGNTRNTVMQLRKKSAETPPATTTPAPPPPATPGAPAKMTTDERLQAMADLDDPGKAGVAMAKILAEDSGFDFERARREQREADETKAADDHKKYLGEQVNIFMRENPDYYGSANNGRLLRDATFRRVGNKPTAEDWATSFKELDAMGVLESAPASDEPLATPPKEPSAPQSETPSSSTGFRPSQLRGDGRPGPAGSKMTRAEALDLAETDDYDYRIKSEPGFKAKIEAALLRK